MKKLLVTIAMLGISSLSLAESQMDDIELTCEEVQPGVCRAMTVYCVGGAYLKLNGEVINGFMHSHNDDAQAQCESHLRSVAEAIKILK